MVKYVYAIYAVILSGCDPMVLGLDQTKYVACLSDVKASALNFGIKLTSDSAPTDLQKMSRALCRAVGAISTKMGRPYEEVTAPLSGFTIEVIGAGSSFTDPGGEKVTGLTYCNSKFIRLADDNWAGGTLTHELVHASLCPETTKNYQHIDWDVNGANDAIFLGPESL